MKSFRWDTDRTSETDSLNWFLGTAGCAHTLGRSKVLFSGCWAQQGDLILNYTSSVCLTNIFREGYVDKMFYDVWNPTSIQFCG